MPLDKEIVPYNPLAKFNLGKSVADALLDQPVVVLPANPRSRGSGKFHGAGIYAIYYIGYFEPYAPIRQQNINDEYDLPIYVGKAVPPGARKGGAAEEQYLRSYALYNRLREHAESIDQCENLQVEDFKCRFLVVDDIWISLGEFLLIDKFKPHWNRVVDGFGIHDPGTGRAGQKRSAWDTLHPGRRIARSLPDNASKLEHILERISEHWST